MRPMDFFSSTVEKHGVCAAFMGLPLDAATMVCR